MNIKKIINTNSIGFWIVVFFVMRLYGITQPPLEVAHNWRQTNVAMVARNFLEVNANIFYPRIDVAGDKSGITGMEFPLLNYLIYLFSLVFGYEHWYGRLINLIVSSFGIWYFFKLVIKFFSKPIAFNASIVLLVSIWFAYSRKMMPDTFSASIVMAGMYYGTNYLFERKQLFQLLLYTLLCSLGILSKLPSGYLLVLFLLPILDRNIPVSRKIFFSMASAVILIATAAWYFYWVPYLVETYEFWYYYMGKSFADGATEIWQNMGDVLAQFYENALKFLGFAAFVAGIIIAIMNRNKLLLKILALGFFTFSIFIIKAGFAFAHHSYYIVPFVPLMALLAGYALAQIKKHKIAILLLFAIAAEGILNQQHDFRISKEITPLEGLEADLDRLSKPNDLILINSGQQPTPMYFAHRKGWLANNDEIKNSDYIRSLQEKGLLYIVIIKKKFGSDMTLDYEILVENDLYKIYKL